MQKRLAGLGVTEVHIAVKDKVALLAELAAATSVQPGEMLYMGDDMPDIAAMLHCGLRTCPADAVGEIRQIAHYISPFAGGSGCVRDVIEKVMKINGHWE